MEPQWGGEKSLTAAEKDHTLTDRVCAFKTSWAECRDQKRCRHRANGGDFSLDIHSYRTFLRNSCRPGERSLNGLWTRICTRQSDAPLKGSGTRLPRRSGGTATGDGTARR